LPVQSLLIKIKIKKTVNVKERSRQPRREDKRVADGRQPLKRKEKQKEELAQKKGNNQGG
jgi:hypothetical protein